MASSAAVDPRVQAMEPMSAELAAGVVAFARAGRSAVRAISLYPGEHPAVAAALEALAEAARAATASAPLPLDVLPDAVTVKGQSLARPEAAVADVAAILHGHMV